MNYLKVNHLKLEEFRHFF